jgi:hypothetical protein
LTCAAAGFVHGQEASNFFELDGSILRIDFTKIPSSHLRGLVNGEEVPLSNAGTRAGVMKPPRATLDEYRTFHIPFSTGIEAEAATVLYRGPPLPSIRIAYLSIEVYGLNNDHTLSFLFQSPDGVEREISMGRLTFDGERQMFASTSSAAGPFSFAGLRVYSPALEQPSQRLLLLSVGSIEFSSRRDP